MSEIALYNLLTRMGANPEEAKEAIADIASSKEVATKADLKTGLANLEARLIEKIANQEARLIEKIANQDAKMEAAHRNMIMWMIGVGLAVVGIIKYL